MNSPRYGLKTTEHDISQEHAVPVAISQPSPQLFNAPAAATTAHPGRTLASYLEVPFMNKRLILACTLMGILMGWLAILVWPRSYQSETKLKIRVGRESVSLDPTVTTGSTLMLQKTQEEEIYSALEILNSRHVAESVVDNLGARSILRGVLPDDSPAELDETSVGGILASLQGTTSRWLSNVGITSESVHGVLQKAGVKDDISNRELAVLKLHSCVNVQSPRKSTVIIVSAQSKTPKMAQAIAKEVCESFLVEHLLWGHTVGSYEFFVQQSAETEEQLNELTAQRSKFMQDRDILSIDANRELLQSQLEGIDRDMVIASGEAEQATSEIKDLTAKVDGADDDLVAGKFAADSTWAGMRQRVYELELEEGGLAATNTDKHPKLKQIREQLRRAQEILAKLKDEQAPNPVKVSLYTELQRQQTRLVGLQSMIDKKEKQRAGMVDEINELLEQERQLIDMDRNIALVGASLKMMREKLEEARIIDSLQSKKISNVQVFQPATFAERAVSPKKKTLAAGFLFLGLMTGLALSFLRESASPTLRTVDDIELELGASVACSIPRLENMGSPRLKNKKIYRKKCQELMADILMTQHRPTQRRGRSLGIIGVDVCAGASTLAVNLAIASDVDCHLKTVLVDADSRNRSVSEMFGLNGVPGLVELLRGTASHDECLQRVENGKIELIASSADSCDEMLSNSAAEIEQALKAYLQDCDLLIVDLPAASQPDQAVALAQHLDCILVVTESEKTKTVAADRLLNRLSHCNTEVIGVVLNKTHDYVPKWIRRCLAAQV